MWNYIYYCQTIFLLTNAVLQPKPTVKTNPHHDVEAVFADVIRNISRVNDVLQELIQNYEHLQKIYKSQEIVESDVSSDNEIDKEFKGKRLSITTKKPSKHNYQLATEVIWSDIDKFGDENTKKLKHNKEIKKTGRVPYIQSLHAGKEKQKKTKSSLESSSNDVSKENYTKDKVAFTDNKKKPSKNKYNDKSSKVEKKHANAEIPKTKHYKVLQSYPFDSDTKLNENKKKRNLEPRNFLRQANLTNIRKEPTAKTYAVNVLKSGSKLNISIRSHGLHKKLSQHTKNYNEQNTTRSGKKTALILINNDMLNQFSASSENSSAEDEAIDKDSFKTNVLRQAYGDACLKLVIKKCFKACKSTLKLSCREYRCKSDFKNKFKQSSKTGCIKEFETIAPKDITPEGYLDAACSDDFKTDPVFLRNATLPLPLPSKASDGDENVNLLRDRLEKACKKVSTKKCEAACNYAVKESCAAFQCRSSHKKKFHRNCKSQCRFSYGASSSSNRKDSSSGSTSGSSSTDDSGSSYDDSTSF